MARHIKVLANDSEVSEKLCEYIAEKSRTAITERGVFTIGLSGGSAAKFLCNGLPKQEIDWSKWRVFFCDERHVDFSDKECTFAIFKRDLMPKVGLSGDHIYPDRPEKSVEEAAVMYEEDIRSVFPGDSLPRFDVLVLGMGPDGHCCSLFPGHRLLQVTDRLIAPIKDSPKPPAERITMTFPIINNARAAVFASCGSGKAEMVKRVLEDNSSRHYQQQPLLPAAMVKPKEGELVWFLDAGAARLLSNI